jgi:hypothetical protein
LIDWINLFFSWSICISVLGPHCYVWGSGNYASALYIAAVKANAAEKVDPEPAQFVVGKE